MGLLVLEMVAKMGKSLDQMVAELLEEVGPSHYARLDQRLSHPVVKSRMVAKLTQEAPSSIGGVNVLKVEDSDGVKYILDDNSWLLIRPSGTEPVLRIYAEALQPERTEALMAYGAALASA